METDPDLFSNRPFSSRKPLYEWAEVADYWPKRLLHIPSMTSVEREGFSCYGTVERPEYSILTYTWGRWRIRSGPPGPSLPVKGTPWRIPAVHPDHFTVESFEKVIKRLGQSGNEWAWVDIACIHQEDAAENAEEVGRQASIFKNAKDVFVWLSHLDTNVLQEAVNNIIEYGVDFGEFVSMGGMSIGKLVDPNIPMELAHTASPRSLAEAVSAMVAGFETIFADPWFSSLWTLQEVVLRNDSLVLTKQADLIVWTENKYYMFLTMFINHCTNIYDDILLFKKNISIHDWHISEDEKISYDAKLKDVQEKLDRIIEMINHAGFYYLHSLNPNVQYGTARYRKTSRLLDRVYAITQVYNIRVGKSIRPQENPTLDELKDEFARAIINRCPIMGQLFLHTGKPEDGKSWRITEDSFVPRPMLMYQEPKPNCKFEFGSDGSVKVRGGVCSYPKLYDALKFKMSAEHRVFLDRGFMEKTGGDCVGDSMTVSSLHKTLDKMPPRLVSTYVGQRDIWLLHLGSRRGSKIPGTGKYFPCNIGLLLCRSEWGTQAGGLDTAFQRIGIFIWECRDNSGGLAPQDRESSDMNKEKSSEVDWIEKEVLLH
ncbi:hypothetical protein TWF730_005327 [Orbilia blumenaviensis]|uniref:Heterokaryon incompatibility domain-containing protein n=1 Tax=Orbilia blumenaviensis TaxID=1796055 RepID=A0AAV9VIH7_9PEZI